MLRSARPLPRADYRGRLGRRLRASDPGWGPRREHLWLTVGGLLITGVVLLVAGALVSL